MSLENAKTRSVSPHTLTIATSPIAAPDPALYPVVDDRLMWQVWTSEFQLPALTVADELGVFPLLAKAPATVPAIQTQLPLGPGGGNAAWSACRHGVSGTTRGESYWPALF